MVNITIHSFINIEIKCIYNYIIINFVKILFSINKFKYMILIIILDIY